MWQLNPSAPLVALATLSTWVWRRAPVPGSRELMLTDAIVVDGKGRVLEHRSSPTQHLRAADAAGSVAEHGGLDADGADGATGTVGRQPRREARQSGGSRSGLSHRRKVARLLPHLRCQVVRPPSALELAAVSSIEGLKD